MATTRIDTVDQYDDTPEGWFKRWTVELDAAAEEVKDWHEKGDKVGARFLDEREGSDNGTRLNLFSANTQTQRAMLYGKVPSADVTRKFGDAKDDVARVAGEILERVLNCDIERDGDGYKDAVGYALDDRLLPGLGQARVRYTVEMGTREVPPKMGPAPMAAGTLPMGAVAEVELAPGYKKEYKAFEDVETDYVHWKDFRWSPARVWPEVRWVAFRVWMTREDLIARFGEEIGGAVPLDSVGPQSEAAKKERATIDPWGRAEVWEIWNKDSREVFWYSPGFPQTLDRQKDPLGLAAFFPCPRPMVANATTAKFLPLPEFCLAQDQYDEVDQVSTRISALQRAIAVRGVYNGAANGVKQLLGETGNNELVAVDNWAMFAEGGGLKGQVDWFPLDMVVGALKQLEEYRDKLVMQIYQVTGMSDIMRGQAQVAGTATEQAIKARFASVRIQAIQDEVSRFASDLLKLRGEVISKHFDDETIVKRANMAGGNDQHLVGPALALIRDDFQGYRIEVKPENINLADAAAMKNERMEFMTALGGFVQQTLPLRQMDAKAGALLNEVMGWALASFKGSSQIEGAFDRYTAEASEAAANPKPKGPPPQVMIEQIKQKGQMQQTQADLQADLARTDAETRAEIAKQTAQARADMAVDRNKEEAVMRNEERKAGLQALVDATRGGGF